MAQEKHIQVNYVDVTTEADELLYREVVDLAYGIETTHSPEVHFYDAQPTCVRCGVLAEGQRVRVVGGMSFDVSGGVKA